jgi:NADH-quinone oxidoreductase subunit E
MANRRLADESVQPESFAFTAENAAWAEKVITKYPEGRQASAVIPLLMRAQEQEGWVSRATIEHVADMLGMPYIRALEVATFYTQFQIKPVGTKAHVQVCGTTPCMLRGAGELMDVCRSKIHPEQLHTNDSGTLSWEEVECQGACVNAPMVMIFKDTYEDLTAERLAEIIDAFEAGRGDEVPAGPQNGRVYSAPIAGQATLTDETIFFKENRDRAARPSAASGVDAAAVPPTQAAKPKTDAIETSPAVKSPSEVKASAKAENAASVVAPAGNGKAADTAVNGKPRAHWQAGGSRPRLQGARSRRGRASRWGGGLARRSQPPRRHGPPGSARRPSADRRHRPEERGAAARPRHLHLRPDRRVEGCRARMGRQLSALQGPHRARGVGQAGRRARQRRRSRIYPRLRQEAEVRG